jgi:hypothetical protein
MTFIFGIISMKEKMWNRLLETGHGTQHIKKDRDYFLKKKAGYKPYPFHTRTRMKKSSAGSLFKMISMFKKRMVSNFEYRVVDKILDEMRGRAELLSESLFPRGEFFFR